MGRGVAKRSGGEIARSRWQGQGEQLTLAATHARS